MGFTTPLSGLNAATVDLSVTANNIANVNTTGFKQSRAEFGDVFAVSTFGIARNAVGTGVAVANVAQQFAQGNVNFTDNNLDMAISGNGFFTLAAPDGTISYTRAGAFGADKNGNIVNSAGQFLQVFPPLTGGIGFNTGSLSNLQLSNADNPPSATSNVTVGTNLPANATAPVLAFDPTDPTTYNHTTSLSVFDSLGVSHVTTLYYVKTANVNEWSLNTYIDGTASGTGDLLTFSSSGVLAGINGTPTPPTTLALATPYVTGNGSSDIALTLQLGNSTQFGEKFAINSLSQDGFTTGRLTGVDISADGVVLARYTNGQSTALGQVAMTTFANPQGLQSLGNTTWGETSESGLALRGQAGSASFGSVQSGALEASNVDLTEQLVNMITAQRNFQANAQMISTDDQITQTVINIRR